MSEIFLDTETTGLSFRDGHKLVEIACIETEDFVPTKKIFHKFINPKRNVPDEAFKIHKDEVGHIPLHQQPLSWGVSEKIKLVQRPDNVLDLRYINKN